MIYWIRRIARIIAFLSFFVIFFCGIDLDDPFNGYTAAIALLKAFCGAALLWGAGFVIFDIVLKGAVEDIPEETLEVLDGGLIQRIHETKNTRKVADGTETEELKAEEEKDKKGKKEKKGKKDKKDKKE